MPPSRRRTFATSLPPSSSTPSLPASPSTAATSLAAARSSSTPSPSRPLASYAMPWTAVGALIELARAYLAIADTAGARTAVAEAERVLRRRPDLGLFTERVGELRRQVDEAAISLAGPSTLTAAGSPGAAAALHAPHPEGDRGPAHQLPQHHPLPCGSTWTRSSRSAAAARPSSRAIELGPLEPFPGLRLTARSQPDRDWTARSAKST